MKEDVVVTAVSGGEATAQISFTGDEITHLLWRGQDQYDALDRDGQKHIDLESSIARKLGAARDLMAGVCNRGTDATGEGVDFMELMSDKQVIGGAFELAILLQYACEHHGLKPTAGNMAVMHDQITDEKPLNRAAALEYAGYLIESAAGDLAGDGAGVDPVFPF